MAEDCISYGVDSDDFTVTHLFLIEHSESVTLLESEEVYRPGIYVRKAYDEKRRHAGCPHVHPKGTVDGHVRIALLHCHRLFVHPGTIWSSTVEDYAACLISVIYEVLQNRIFVVGTILLSDAESLYVKDLF